MSTFNGFVAEIPQIRIDHFRLQPHRPQPLACFLSHIHSDHLTGLESFKGPFIYCSAATREILLRLERYPHRMNFAKGLTEVRKQTYKHLAKLLRPLPLETPTAIELAPGMTINVTLFDANHCTGAIMFLIESAEHSILYTGDIRAEKWWVDMLIRRPFLLPFFASPFGAGTKRLDAVYLDPTFATRRAPFQKFPSKAEGLSELLRQVAQYPPKTYFYLHAWTFGYEDVMRALSHMCRTPIHLDEYRHRIYASLGRGCGTEEAGGRSSEAAAFSGFLLGNAKHQGIVTTAESVRLHSCERGTGCWASDHGVGDEVVHIKPIITRHNDEAIEETGLGGGQGDLDQIHELELGDADAIARLIALCEQETRDHGDLAKVKQVLLSKLDEPGQLSRVRLDGNRQHDDTLGDSIRLEQLAAFLKQSVDRSEDKSQHPFASSDGRLPKLILFPYSRHSSFEELYSLVERLRPRDVYPCTAPKAEQFDESKSMRALFGDACLRAEDHGNVHFRWDCEISAEYEQLPQKCRMVDTLAQTSQCLDDDTTQQVQEAPAGEFRQSIYFTAVSDTPASWSRDAMHYTAKDTQAERHSSIPNKAISGHAGLHRERSRQIAYKAATHGDWAGVRLHSTSDKRRRLEEER